MKRTKSRKAVATETWRLLSEYTMATFTSRAGVLQEMGLTPGHLKALRVLDASDARPMGACAHAVGCDASTATWLVDRLEERGLVERRASTTDRRVKGVVLTPFGAETKAKLEAHFGEPPASLLDLDADALETLHDALVRLSESR
jgi:DNA-binding MarR family transcriptional regulator